MKINEWNEYLLEDVIDRFIDYRGKTPKKTNSGIPLITAKIVKNGFIQKANEFISEDNYTSWMTRGFPETNDVVVTTEAPLGEVAQIKTNNKVALAQRIITLRGKKEVLDNTFLRYFLQSEVGQSRLYARATGTTVIGIKSAELRKVSILMPQYHEQKSIVATLSCLDEKIELNHKINDNLAGILQALYQERFGVTNQATANGHLGDICQYSKSRISVSELSLDNYYSTENMLFGKCGAVQAASLPSITKTTHCSTGDVLVSNIRPYFKKIFYCQNEGGCSTDVLCLTPRVASLSAYLYSTLYSDQFFDFMVAGSRGTKMPRGDKQQIMTYPIHNPKDDELAEFNDVATPILVQIKLNEAVSNHLADIRDIILPKLMSGELDVSSVKF